jgi:23S rRNA (cytidine1920-2'-O)/16S rRNA (cytidine1409-2'-O)-methyltransferase
MEAGMTAAKSNEKLRLDDLLVRRGLYASRSRARDAVLRGSVQADGRTLAKPGAMLAADSMLETLDAAQSYVSRAALKLVCGLNHFALSPKGLNALDIGASTGGFTQVLLERGAAHVTAIDVGHGQMHASLLNDSRISNLEGVNARGLSAAHFGGKTIDFVVSDVSFISLKLALPNALSLAEPGAHCVLLVKPQFEAGRQAIGKGGLLKDKSLGERIAHEVSEWLGTQPGWRSLGFSPSPINGGDGNAEFLLAGIKDQ